MSTEEVLVDFEQALLHDTATKSETITSVRNVLTKLSRQLQEFARLPVSEASFKMLGSCQLEILDIIDRALTKLIPEISDSPAQLRSVFATSLEAEVQDALRQCVNFQNECAESLRVSLEQLATATHVACVNEAKSELSQDPSLGTSAGGDDEKDCLLSAFHSQAAAARRRSLEALVQKEKNRTSQLHGFIARHMRSLLGEQFERMCAQLLATEASAEQATVQALSNLSHAPELRGTNSVMVKSQFELIRDTLTTLRGSVRGFEGHDVEQLRSDVLGQVQQLHVQVSAGLSLMQQSSGEASVGGIAPNASEATSARSGDAAAGLKVPDIPGGCAQDVELLSSLAEESAGLGESSTKAEALSGVQMEAVADNDTQDRERKKGTVSRYHFLPACHQGLRSRPPNNASAADILGSAGKYLPSHGQAHEQGIRGRATVPPVLANRGRSWVGGEIVDALAPSSQSSYQPPSVTSSSKPEKSPERSRKVAGSCERVRSPSPSRTPSAGRTRRKQESKGPWRGGGTPPTRSRESCPVYRSDGMRAPKRSPKQVFRATQDDTASGAIREASPKGSIKSVPMKGSISMAEVSKMTSSSRSTAEEPGTSQRVGGLRDENFNHSQSTEPALPPSLPTTPKRKQQREASATYPLPVNVQNEKLLIQRQDLQEKRHYIVARLASQEQGKDSTMPRSPETSKVLTSSCQNLQMSRDGANSPARTLTASQSACVLAGGNRQPEKPTPSTPLSPTISQRCTDQNSYSGPQLQQLRSSNSRFANSPGAQTPQSPQQAPLVTLATMTLAQAGFPASCLGTSAARTSSVTCLATPSGSLPKQVSPGPLPHRSTIAVPSSAWLVAHPGPTQGNL